jgi:DNA-directed RNA polymerase subunit E'/Rpb7
MSFINVQMINSNLNLDSKDINSDIDNIIRMKLKEKVEGKCYEDGYIVEGSVKIIKRGIGSIATTNNKSSIRYNITYNAEVISPSNGDKIEVIVNNVNKMGVLSHVRLNKKDVENHEDSPMIIMLPREYFDESTRNIDDLTVGQKIDIMVVGCRIKYGSDKIQVIARPL